MKDKLINTPEGVRDIYNSECEKKLRIESTLLDVIRIYGYEDIETPTFEYFDIFSEERGTVKAKDMYKFFDREGNTLVLRPDITPSIARCIAKYYRDMVTPVRLCYRANTFINSSEYQGKPKETTQIGAELVGDDSVEADAEMVAMTVDCLLSIGLKDFLVEVGEVGFFKAIVAEAGLDTDETEQLMKLINDKNTFGLEDFLERADVSPELKKIFINLPSLFGSFERLGEFKKMTGNPEAIRSIDRLEKLYGLMKRYGYGKYISFDLGMLSKYGYYTGIIFNVYTHGIGDTLLSGGRYDKLMGQFGEDRAAVGMAFVVDRIMSALSRQGIDDTAVNDKLLIVTSSAKYDDALQMAITTRKSGRRCEIYVHGGHAGEEEKTGFMKTFNAGSVIVLD